MSINQNWPRWIFASISKHFDTLRQDIPMYLEGDDRDTANETDYFELRINGPVMKEMCMDCWRADACINVLISSKRNDKSIHTLHKNVGILAAVFTNSIEVYQYGDSPTTLIGCLVLTKVGNDTLDIQNLGIMNPDLLINQSSITAYYRMYLDK